MDDQINKKIEMDLDVVTQMASRIAELTKEVEWWKKYAYHTQYIAWGAVLFIMALALIIGLIERS